MEHILMKRRVKAEAMTEHLELLESIFAELAEQPPSDFGWVVYQLDDPHEFVELSWAPRLPGPLPDLESFRRYRAGLEDRCETYSADQLVPIAAHGIPR